MTRHLLPGNPPIEVILRRSARARRISLRVSAIDGRVTLTMPHHASEREALAFANEKAAWLRRNVEKRDSTVPVRLGAVVPLLGQPRLVVAGKGRSVHLGDSEIAVPGEPDRAGARLHGFLKETARRHLAEASDRYAAALGRHYSRITLRDTRSRWGSCTADGGLMYSWRLIMAPQHVLEYVAAHEVAHLAEMNHSPRFWAHVENLYGDHRAARKWLRGEGAALHRFQF